MRVTHMSGIKTYRCHTSSCNCCFVRPLVHAQVSLGILKWVQSQVSRETFCASPSFLSYAPVFLKLCGQTTDEHPAQRPQVFEVRVREASCIAYVPEETRSRWLWPYRVEWKIAERQSHSWRSREGEAHFVVCCAEHQCLGRSNPPGVALRPVRAGDVLPPSVCELVWTSNERFEWKSAPLCLVVWYDRFWSHMNRGFPCPQLWRIRLADATLFCSCAA